MNFTDSERTVIIYALLRQADLLRKAADELDRADDAEELHDRGRTVRALAEKVRGG